MKDNRRHKYRYLVVGLVNLAMLGYIALVILVILGKIGTPDDWKIANYCTFNIDSDVLDEHSSLVVDGNKIYYEYEHQEGHYLYKEKIRFSSDNRGAIGGYDSHTYLYKAVDSIEISFTLENASIYKLEFIDTKASNIDDDTDPKSISKNSYKVNNKCNVYTLTYNKNSDIYIYSVSILYLVKK